MNLNRILKMQTDISTRTTGKRRAIWEAKARLEASGLTFNNNVKNNPSFYNSVHLMYVAAITFANNTQTFEFENGTGMNMNDINVFVSEVRSGKAKVPNDWDTLLSEAKKKADEEKAAIIQATDPIQWIMDNLTDYDFTLEDNADRPTVCKVVERKPSKEEAETLYLQMTS